MTLLPLGYMKKHLPGRNITALCRHPQIEIQGLWHRAWGMEFCQLVD